MELDDNRKDTPYLLGRLFALLEKTQSDAVGAVGASIKDRYIAPLPLRRFWSSRNCCAWPSTISGKAGYGKYNEDKIAGVMRGIDVFPPHLNPAGTGRFLHRLLPSARRQLSEKGKGVSHVRSCQPL